MSRPRIVDVPMSQPGQLAAFVARFAIDPTCPQCGGPAELKPGPGGTVDVHVDHRDGCKLLNNR